MAVYLSDVQILAGIAPRCDESCGTGAILAKPIMSLALPEKCQGQSLALWMFAPGVREFAAQRRYEPIAATRVVGAESAAMAEVLEVFLRNRRCEFPGRYDLQRRFALALVPTPIDYGCVADDLSDALSGQIETVIDGLEKEFTEVAQSNRWPVALNRWMNLRELRGIRSGSDVRMIWTAWDRSGAESSRRIVDDALSVPVVMPVVVERGLGLGEG